MAYNASILLNLIIYDIVVSVMLQNSFSLFWFGCYISRGIFMIENDENKLSEGRAKTEAEYSAQVIKLLLSIIKWLVIAIVTIILMFLGTVIYLVGSGVEIEIGRSNNKASIITTYVDNNKNSTTKDV